jgi:hypothetical protein
MNGRRLFLLAAALLLAGPWATAQAGVRFGLGINIPLCFPCCAPRPVYVAPPPPVYVVPQPVYVVPAAPAVYAQPAPVYQAAPARAVAPAYSPPPPVPAAP